MEKTSIKTAVFTDNESTNGMNISSSSYTLPQPCDDFDNGGVSNDDSGLIMLDNTSGSYEKFPSQIESKLSETVREEHGPDVELNKKNDYFGTVSSEEQDFYTNDRVVSSTDEYSQESVKEITKAETDNSSRIALFKTSDFNNAIDLTNKSNVESLSEFISEDNETCEEAQSVSIKSEPAEVNVFKDGPINNNVKYEGSQLVPTENEPEVTVFKDIPVENKDKHEVQTVSIENEPEVTLFKSRPIEHCEIYEEAQLFKIENEPEVTVFEERPFEHNEKYEEIQPVSLKHKSDVTVINDRPFEYNEEAQLEVSIEKDQSIEHDEKYEETDSVLIQNTPDVTVFHDTHIESCDEDESSSSDIKGGLLFDVSPMENKSKEANTKPVFKTESTFVPGQENCVDTESIEELPLTSVEILNNVAHPNVEIIDPKEETWETDPNIEVNNKVQAPTKKATTFRKSVSDGNVTKVKPQKERKVSTARDGAAKSTGRKISTPRNSLVKKDEQKISIGKDNRAPSTARKIGVDHTREKLNQTSSVKDTKIQKPVTTDTSSLLFNPGSDDFKTRQASEKEDSEKKQQPVFRTKKNSDVEHSPPENGYENESIKEVERTMIKDQNNDSNSRPTVTKVNETEESKKSQNVKWNEKLTIQLKNDGKQLPNGSSKGNNQEKEKHLKTEPISKNEHDPSSADEKGKYIVVNEESEETSNEKDNDKFDPKSILAKAAWKKGGKGKSVQGSVAMNGPTFIATKTQSKSSLAVHTGSTVEDKEDKLSVESRRDSTMLSLDSVSHKSVDLRNATAIVNPVAEEKPRPLLNSNDSWIRSAIPYQPLSLSILCLFLNTIIPGSGTIVSGLCILCCGKTRVTSKDDHVPITVCVNVWVGVAQLFTITFCLVGWFWSIAWGIKMVILSVEYRRELKAKREKELQAMALSAFGSPSRGRPLFPGMA